jgi:hypothetical protein
MLARDQANLASAVINEPLGLVLADVGYYSTKNATLKPWRIFRCHLERAQAAERAIRLRRRAA